MKAIFLSLFVLISSIVSAQEKLEFAKSSGTDFIKGDSVLRIKALTFNSPGNNERLLKNYQSAMKVAKREGFNTVRVELNFEILRPTRFYFVIEPEYYKFVDNVLEESKKYDLNVILALREVSSEEHLLLSDFYWNDKYARLKFYHLWMKLADRYKNEDQIIALDLMSSVPENVKKLQYGYLANQMIYALRTVDTNHTLIIPYCHKYLKEESLKNSIKIKDDNFAYATSFYNPVEYSLQKTGLNDDERKYKYPKSSKEDNSSLDSLQNQWEQKASLVAKQGKLLLINEIGLSKSAFRKLTNAKSYFFDLKRLTSEKKIQYALQSLSGDNFGIYKSGRNRFRIGCFKKSKIRKLNSQ